MPSTKFGDAVRRLDTAAPRTLDANSALCDIEQLAPAVQRGYLITTNGDLRAALTLDGLSDVAYSTESTDDVRAALRAYAEWLIAVADKAA